MAAGKIDPRYQCEPVPAMSGDYVLSSEKGQPNGVSTLNQAGQIPSSQLPPIAISDVYAVNTEAAMLALQAERGDVCIRSDLSKTFILSNESPSILGSWFEILSVVGVTSVFGRTGVVAAQSGDYTGAQIAFIPVSGITATNIQDAIAALQQNKLEASAVSQAIFNANKLQSIGISSTAPVEGQILVFTSGSYVPTTVSFGGSSTITVENHTETSSSPHVIAAEDQGKVFTNAGASAENYLSLPSASAGLWFTFNIVAAVGMRIVPQSGNYIQVDSTLSKSGGYLESTYVGASISLLAINSTTWVATTLVGQWVVETA